MERGLHCTCIEHPKDASRELEHACESSKALHHASLMILRPMPLDF